MKAEQRKLLLFGGLGLGAFWLLSKAGSAPGATRQLSPAELLAAGLTPDEIRQAAGYPQITIAQAVAWGYSNAFVGARVTMPGDPSKQYLVIP